MTWLRWETTVPQHEVVGNLATALGIHPMQALGHYIACCSGFGNYVHSGQTLDVQDVTLEGWANWPQGRRTRGRFAEAFRALCTEHREGQHDAVGVIKGWWRNESWLRKQERDRKKPGEGTRKARTGPRGAFRGPSGGNVDVVVDPIGSTPNGDVNEKHTTTTGSAENPEKRPLRATDTISPADYAMRCTVAVNRGLRENPTIGGAFRELATSNNVEQADAWREARIPVEVAVDAIYTRCQEIQRPAGTTKQPHNLKYFDNRVREAYEHMQQRAHEGDITPSQNGRAPPQDDTQGQLAQWALRKQTQIDQRGKNGKTGQADSLGHGGADGEAVDRVRGQT